ncbi:hypothetical protein P7K49_002652 [Saguinus oedipus]|uniref:Uncharacterized protein n=1 Tax=Saguinus oedipus TaxID=9490 RepID=A0ABQ9WIX3_SAGOE|nr:hypothetical protein P7K49_002652 [Saguinus oedipus]
MPHSQPQVLTHAAAPTCSFTRGGPTGTLEGPHAASAVPHSPKTAKAPSIPTPTPKLPCCSSSPAGGQCPPRGHPSLETLPPTTWLLLPPARGGGPALRPTLAPTSFLTVRSSLCRVSASVGQDARAAGQPRGGRGGHGLPSRRPRVPQPLTRGGRGHGSEPLSSESREVGAAAAPPASALLLQRRRGGAER